MIELQAGNINEVLLMERKGSRLLVSRKPQQKVNVLEAREFEFANLMYRLSRAAHRGRFTQLPVLGEIYKDIISSQQVRKLYDRNTLLRFTQRFADLSSGEGTTKLPGMTPIIQPEYSAELFTFLIDVLKSSIRQSE